ncbi:hypothetical protein BTW10_04635 [Chromohalobacter japonicus]|uniref:Uncharacterized protein n=2 Tax=Chromohalobacter japonicus TaxID=223900 RepID=A0A1Q8TGM2_9GAMM|nr:hypothetical protein BTW10_04635 [Chromohalobacter japonicus]
MSKPTSVRDINDKYDYEDEYPKGEGDSPKVACGQDGTYNELRYIYDTYLKPEVERNTITNQQAIDALDSACSSLSNPRSREDFYAHLEKELGIEI